MGTESPLERWCWRKKDRTFSDPEMLALAQHLSRKETISSKDLEKKVAGAREKHSSGQNSVSKDRFTKSLKGALGSENASSRPLPSKYEHSHAPGSTPEKNSNGSASEAASGTSVPDGQFEKTARELLDLASSHLSEKQSKSMEQEIAAVSTDEAMRRFAARIARHLNGSSGDAESSAGADDRSGGKDHLQRVSVHRSGYDDTATTDSMSRQPSSRTVPADRFVRSTVSGTEKEKFNGIASGRDVYAAWDKKRPEKPLDPLFLLQAIEHAEREYRQDPAEGICRDMKEIEPGEIQELIERLKEQKIVSPTFEDTFFVNRDRIALILAKKAYRDLSAISSRRRPLRTGTHQCGSRGIHGLITDKVQRARHLSPHLAIVQTLRRGLARKTLYPDSFLIDDDDLVEFASRKKVGYSVVIAIDISGAVQFGHRIRSVRKACLAFAYYMRRFQPRDRVRYIAYHETPREIDFADVSRLRAVNGAGKDIGACLKKCREILLRDPDRIPVVILIGDGLPARGECSGFYRFMENNREVIHKAYDAARMLSREGIRFTFLQFREQRHVWTDYADTTAAAIVREARGRLYTINGFEDIAASLDGTYGALRAFS